MGLILHVVPDLGPNGPARQLSLFAPALTANNWQSHVAVMRTGEVFEPALRAAGIPVHDLGATHRLDARPWLSLKRLIAELRPDVVHARRRSAFRLVGLVQWWHGRKNVVASDLGTCGPQAGTIRPLAAALRGLRGRQ